MEKEEFYRCVYQILELDDKYIESKPYRRRWGQREPGNGRFEGYGLIRWFSCDMIHISIIGMNRLFKNPTDALNALRIRITA
jgi:hypothetical protein